MTPGKLTTPGKASCSGVADRSQRSFCGRLSLFSAKKVKTAEMIVLRLNVMSPAADFESSAIEDARISNWKVIRPWPGHLVTR